MARAGGRCEGPLFLAWGRCRQPAAEADHIYPWSRSGPTVVGNGQALCRDHNRRKASHRPPWWYVRGLERRRLSYFPPDVDVTVVARLTEADRAARQASNLRHRST
ncbi:HNH endonuclease [Nocardioides stalactiti]|uniref:HNH endonuclease n=1 Tax=Nocardioides stalactiti TaxID=2755356 RepID=UPI0035E4398F